MAELSIVMPAYNEAENIAGALDDIAEHVLAAVPDAEVIVVDDGSTDDTAAILAERAARERQLVVVTQANAGHGAALAHGLSLATGEVLLLLDSDRQVSLADFPAHWDALHRDGLAAIFGVRAERHDPLHRLFVTRAMRLMIRLMFGAAPRDGGVPYKLIRQSVWRDIAPLIHAGCQIPSVLAAIAIMRKHGREVRQITVRHLARQGGQSTLNVPRLARLCARATGDLLRLRRELNASK